MVLGGGGGGGGGGQSEIELRQLDFFMNVLIFEIKFVVYKSHDSQISSRNEIMNIWYIN